MPEKITSSNFESTLDYASLPKAKLLELYRVTITAHRNFFHLWQQAVGDQFGSGVCAELTAQVYPGLAAVGNDLKRVFHEELNFLWSIMPDLHHMLTFARYDASLLPETLDADLDVEALASESLLLLWNVSTLTYVMQTGRWTDALTARFGQGVALKLERSVWLDYGGAEEDLRYGLIAAGAEKGNVETLLRGFQMAPGEVGLVDAEFHLENPNHGWITHKRCPALDRFGESNKERLESSCVLCVIAMRLSGEMVDKGIRCRPASLPPYREPVGHACKWEYWK
ncbi:MAG: hypothetical protein JRG90_13680 [Deltaproteobacteria bacterium]|nr:hypothetical protein [Deltaproteobacteria bacterium]